ncbi:MAG: NAD-dependent epimerase/dehydratase family protein, partial [Phenylobacterium sp.]|nr:NAD-dependent epimerase/dehydratase family protein [Phenylobacterium sp.]
PYAWTKATNTEMVRNYGDWYGLKYAITYFYNVYGPGERAGAYGTLIEIFRQRRLAGEQLRVNAPGTQKRNFTHIDDIVEGLVLVGESGEGDDFGLGDNRAYSILEVAEMFGGEIVMGPEVAGNRMSADIDTSKTRLLGWAPSRALIDYIGKVPGASARPRRG